MLKRPHVIRAGFVAAAVLGAGLLLFSGAIEGLIMRGLYGAIVEDPALNTAVGYVTGPIVKHKFNAPPAPGGHGPPPLDATTVETARKVMAEHFRPDAGKVLVAIAGGGTTTVHAFVVSGVSPDGRVQITQAIAQTLDAPEDYHGVGGKVSKAMDAIERNTSLKMQGVVVADWATYAKISARNSVIVLELATTPAKARAALTALAGVVGRPYDRTMLAADPATVASTQAFYCTELTAWFINSLAPGTVKFSHVANGYPVIQVADHMRATTVHGGPLKVLFNGQDRLDLVALDPKPRDR